MIFQPNSEDKYIFKLKKYELIDKSIVYSFDYVGNALANHNYTRAIVINNVELEYKILSCILNRDIIYIDESKLKVIENECVEITDESQVIIQYTNKIQLRFKIADIGNYWQVYSILYDNKNLNLDEYKYVLQVYDIDIYDYIASNILKNMSIYISKDVSLLDITKDDIIIEDDTKMKLLFNVKDVGSAYQVVGINDCELVLMGHMNSTYQVYSWTIYEAIVNAIMEGSSVYIPKNIEGQLSLDDVVISKNESDLDREKVIAKITITDIIYNTRINKLSIINSFEFIMLTAYFVGLGIYINKDNREDKYIEIINYISDLEDETKSEEIINKFERYLSLIDKMDKFGLYLDTINNTKEEIDNCESIEEVKELVSNFKNEWK
jgi:hypothetical protein